MGTPIYIWSSEVYVTTDFFQLKSELRTVLYDLSLILWDLMLTQGK